MSDLPFQARPLFPLDAADLAADFRRLGLTPEAAASLAAQCSGQAVRIDTVSQEEAQALADRARAASVQVVSGASAHLDGAVDVILVGQQERLRSLDPRIDAAVSAAQWRPGALQLGQHRLDLSRHAAVMGIVNITPDSFFDGGRHDSLDRAVEHGLRLVEEGAEILDVGGDSASGRAARIDAAQEIERVVPAIRAFARQASVPVAVDTHRAATAAAALDAGATMVNDITGLSDPEMARVIGRGGAGVCVMHIKGVPKEFPPDFQYATVPGDVARFLHQRVARALKAGIAPERIVVDPGIEFGKLLGQDLELLRRLPEIQALGYPVLVAASRKDLIGHVLGGLPPAERLEGTAAVIGFSVTRGARIVRVHDVRAMARVVRMTEALMGWRFAPDDPSSRLRSDGALVE